MRFNRKRTIAHAIGKDGSKHVLRCVGRPTRSESSAAKKLPKPPWAGQPVVGLTGDNRLVLEDHHKRPASRTTSTARQWTVGVEPPPSRRLASAVRVTQPSLGDFVNYYPDLG
jgi:hypothetical protein